MANQRHGPNLPRTREGYREYLIQTGQVRPVRKMVRRTGKAVGVLVGVVVVVGVLEKIAEGLLPDLAVSLSTLGAGVLTLAVGGPATVGVALAATGAVSAIDTVRQYAQDYASGSVV